MPIDSQGFWYPELCPAQLKVYNATKRYHLVSGPKKCVSGRTRIFDPTQGDQATIESLCMRNTAPIVMTMQGPALASVPFMKGRSMIYRVEMSDGTSFEATAYHEVLSPSGYVCVGSLRRGSLLLGYDESHLRSISAFCLLTRNEDGQHSSQTAQGYQFCCQTYRRFCGELPPMEEAVFQDAPTSPADAQERIAELACETLDALAGTPKHNHHDQQFCLQQISDGQGQPGEISGSEILSRSSPAILSPWSCLSQPKLQFGSALALTLPFEPLNLGYGHKRSISQSSPIEHAVRINSVKRITELGVEGYYDIQVPGLNHYFAEGSIHHNSGKTIVNMHRIIRHAYETRRARVGMFAKTVKNAKAGGIWNDMVEIALPEWIRDGVTQYTTKKSGGELGPKQDPQSRMMYFKIENQFGGESEIQLHSIDNENEVESIAKGTRFSCFYFAELSNFRKRLVFDITTDQLRMPGLPFEEHLWLADTNPSDEGPDSWIYEIWYKILNKTEPTPAERFLIRHLLLTEIMIEDNLYLTDEEKADLYARFAHDRDLAARYLEGKWVRAVEGAIFSDQFRADTHVLGDCSKIDEDEWEVLLPSEHCHTLITGWDLGDRFHSAHILEPVRSGDSSMYQVIDEVCHLDVETKLGLKEFVEKFMERYWFWTEFLKDRNVTWRHWADQQALNAYKAAAEGYDSNLIYKYSDGNIIVAGAPKFPGSILRRINMTKILLNETRLLISARCFNTIEMFKSLKKGSASKPVADSKFRHPFDSLTYALSGEEPAMLLDEVIEPQKQKGRLITVALNRAV